MTHRNRRRFLSEVASGIGAMALGDLLHADQPRKAHVPGTAKSVIYLFMEGGPSQMDLYDPKPELQKWNGKPAPDSIVKQFQLAFTKNNAAVLASPRVFKPHGQSGMEISDWLPNIASVADDICLVRSVTTDAFNHHPAQCLMFSGSQVVGRPTMGAWSVYGLGSESKDLPAFCVMGTGAGTSGGASNFSSGFLPSTYQGTLLRTSGDPILYLSNPPGISSASQRAGLDALRDLNEEHHMATGDAEVASRIASYELAYRMQTAGPELTDFGKESPETLEMYGINNETTKQYGTSCLMARRLVERGVRFVLLMNASWDSHTQLDKKLKANCDQTDKPVGALIKDLKRRGLLDSTLVVWGGEFGRTPVCEIRNTTEVGNAGRDHHPQGYSMWMAGGGIKGGVSVGETDELGSSAVKNRFHVRNLHATVLQQMGFDPNHLSYFYGGLDQKLVGVEGAEAIHQIIA